MRQNRISVNDIKYDLIKIIEPYDGRLENKEPAGTIVSEIFQSYLPPVSLIPLPYHHHKKNQNLLNHTLV